MSTINLFDLDLDHHVHAGGEWSAFVRFFGKDDFYRNTLGNLHKVATGVVGWQKGELSAGAR